MKPGDLVWWIYSFADVETVTGRCSETVYDASEVIKLGKKKIKIRTEYGGERWVYPSFLYPRDAEEE